MTTNNGPEGEPLWLTIEKKIQGLEPSQLAADTMEQTIQGLARELDAGGIDVSRNAGYMLDLRRAVAARVSAGRPLLEDLDEAVGALTLDDLEDPYRATMDMVGAVGAEWPELQKAERRSHLLTIIEATKLDLLVAKAREAGGESGVRFLIEEEIEPDVIVERLETSREEYDRVLALVEAERAERARVKKLLEEVAGKPDSDRIRHLIQSDVAEDLIMEMGGVDRAAIDEVNEAMEAEIAEKKRLAEEEAARKAAEAAGPSLEDMSPDDMLEHIEAIREILEFSDVEKEIRVMCEQSGVPKALVDIAVSDPDRLDELEAEAEG
jgi:hypothetical protein